MAELYKFTVKAESKTTECFCVGPKNGEPFCRCDMLRRGVYQRDGQWVEPPKGEVIHGPVRDFGPTT